MAEPDLRSLASLASLLANRLAVANLVLWLSFCFASFFLNPRYRESELGRDNKPMQLKSEKEHYYRVQVFVDGAFP